MPAMLTHFLVLELAHEATYGKYLHMFAKPAGECFRKLSAPHFHKAVTGAPCPQATGKPTGLPLSRHAYCGALGPDIVAKAQAWLFDTMHWRDTSHFVLSWLKSYERAGEKFQPELAYIFGFLCHMAADAILHPYVNTFAGFYDQQPVKDTHPFVESNIDCYVAQIYFGRKDLSDNPKGGWGQNLMIEKLSTLGTQFNSNKMLNRMYPLTNRLGKWFQGWSRYHYAPPKGEKRLKAGEFVRSLTLIANGALGLGYDLGVQVMGAAGDKFDKALVSHKYREPGMTVDRYIGWAVNLTKRFWRAAQSWLNAKGKRRGRWNKWSRNKLFLQQVPGLNLDTGFALGVRAEPGKIIIRHEHSWAMYRYLRPPSISGWAPRGKLALNQENFQFTNKLMKAPELPWDEAPNIVRARKARQGAQRQMTYGYRS